MTDSIDSIIASFEGYVNSNDSGLTPDQKSKIAEILTAAKGSLKDLAAGADSAKEAGKLIAFYSKKMGEAGFPDAAVLKWAQTAAKISDALPDIYPTVEKLNQTIEKAKSSKEYEALKTKAQESVKEVQRLSAGSSLTQMPTLADAQQGVISYFDRNIGKDNWLSYGANIAFSGLGMGWNGLKSVFGTVSGSQDGKSLKSLAWGAGGAVAAFWGVTALLGPYTEKVPVIGGMIAPLLGLAAAIMVGVKAYSIANGGPEPARAAPLPASTAVAQSVSNGKNLPDTAKNSAVTLQKSENSLPTLIEDDANNTMGDIQKIEAKDGVLQVTKDDGTLLTSTKLDKKNLDSIMGGLEKIGKQAISLTNEALVYAGKSIQLNAPALVPQ